MEAIFLIAVSFCTSALTAILGLGGGILLISVMPGLLPATAIVCAVAARAGSKPP